MKYLVTFIFSSFVTMNCQAQAMPSQSEAVASQAQTMTLAECVNMGIAHNLQLTNARIGIEKGRLGITQNRSRLLPIIQGVAQFTGYLMNPVNVTTGALLDNDFSDEIGRASCRERVSSPV